MQLYLPANSTTGPQTLFVINPLGASPGPLAANMQLAGEVYDITASGSIAQLDKPGVLSLGYDHNLFIGTVTTATLGIYRWNVNTTQWVKQESVFDQDHNVFSTKVELLGIYALFYQRATVPLSYEIYLPVARR